MSILSTSLVTLAVARSYLGKAASDTPDDTVIETIIDAASAKFDSYVARSLAESTDTALYLDGNGQSVLSLPRFPVVSIAKVYENDAELILGDNEDDCVLYKSSGILDRVGGVWQTGVLNIELTSYIAGYVVQGSSVTTGHFALPADIKLACLTQVAADFQTFKKRDWGETNRSIGGVSVNKADASGLLKEVRDVLDKYRDIRL